MTKKHFLAFVTLVTLFSCTKKDDTSNNSNPILGKWNRQNKIDWYTSFNNPTYNRKDTLISSVGEYIDFRSDNKVYSCYINSVGSPFSYDTSNYVLNNDKLILTTPKYPIPDTIVIQTLTSNKLLLYKKYIGIDNTEEIWNNFTK